MCDDILCVSPATYVPARFPTEKDGCGPRKVHSACKLPVPFCQCKICATLGSDAQLKGVLHVGSVIGQPFNSDVRYSAPGRQKSILSGGSAKDGMQICNFLPKFGFASHCMHEVVYVKNLTLMSWSGFHRKRFETRRWLYFVTRLENVSQ